MCMASKSYVEEDIIIEILLRLQPKSLLRFQTVCKHWLALITSSDFIAAHCKQQPKLSVVFTSWLDQCKIPKPENSCSLRRLTEFGILLLPDGKSRPDYLNIPSSITKDTNSASLVGSSNGLLCVNMVGDRWNKNLDCCVLWNPATRQHRCLPPPLLKSSNDFREFGFGFLPKIGDYKLLRVINFPDEEIRAEVFTSSTGAWREVKATAELGCDIRIYHKPVIVKGVWYCMAARVTKDPGLRFVHFILKFDMANDSFSIMDDGVPDIRHFMVKLMLYKGLLALCFPRRDRLNKWFEVWIMKNESWTKLFLFGHTFDRTLWPIGILNDGKIILQDSPPSIINPIKTLHLYDPFTQILNRVLENGKSRFSPEAHDYVESLVSVYAPAH